MTASPFFPFCQLPLFFPIRDAMLGGVHFASLSTIYFSHNDNSLLFPARVLPRARLCFRAAVRIQTGLRGLPSRYALKRARVHRWSELATCRKRVFGNGKPYRRTTSTRQMEMVDGEEAFPFLNAA